MMKYNILDDYPEFENHQTNNYLFILPILRLEISEKLKIGKYILYPKNTIDFDYLTTNIISEDIIANKDFFNSNTLVTFSEYIEISRPFSKLYDREFVSKAYQEAEKVLNFIKFFYCKYSDPNTLIGKSGQRIDGKSVVFVFQGIGSPFTGIKEDFYLSHLIIKGSGLIIRNFTILKSIKLFENERNEVGNIIIHALELNSMILEANTKTQKFALIMSLMEYLGFPNSFELFKKVKTKIICHNTNNFPDYLDLCQRFEELTGGLKDEKTGEKDIGLRTQIIHIGKIIEDLIVNELELNDLFFELQGYIYHTINDMFNFYDKKWIDLENFRIKKLDEIQKNKIKNPLREDYSENIIIIDLDFLDRDTKKWLPFYQNLYPSKKIKNIYIEDLIIQSCIQTRIEKSNKILSVILVSNKNPNHTFSSKIVNYLIKDFCSFDIKNLYKFDIQTIFTNNTQDKYNFVTDLLNRLSEDNNGLIDEIRGKISNYILCLDDKVYLNFLSEFSKRKKVKLIRLCNTETELCVNEVLFVDVAHIIGMSLGLDVLEL